MGFKDKLKEKAKEAIGKKIGETLSKATGSKTLGKLAEKAIGGKISSKSDDSSKISRKKAKIALEGKSSEFIKGKTIAELRDAKERSTSEKEDGKKSDIGLPSISLPKMKISTVPSLNLMSTKKKAKADEKYKQEQIEKMAKRLQSEDIGKERVEVEARLVSSPPNQDGVNVKIKLSIHDRSFYAQKAKVMYNPGTEKFQDIDMEKLDMDHYAIILANVPKEIQILYYVNILDKSGEWTQFPRPELIQTDGTSEEEPYFSFSVEPDGRISFKKEWDDTGLINCPVCQYACQRSWDNCPECRTPLYDTFQEVFQEDQERKLKAREQIKEDSELSWDDASDEIWRGLPECPSCGYVVQLEWARCPVCKFDLKSVELEKGEAYEEFMTEEEKELAAKEKARIKAEKSKVKTEKDIEKEELKELGWDDDDSGIDIL